MTGAGPKDARGALHAMNDRRPLASEEDAVASEDPDWELVLRTRSGDRTAFRALFDKYHGRIFAIALGVVKNPPDAHDVVQEAFVRVHRHLGGFQGQSSFYTWLYRITMNLSIDYHRRKKNALHVDYDDAVRRGEDDIDDGDNIVSGFAASADPQRAHSRKELAARMQAALSTLPPYHQQVIVLREVDGLSYEEIAKVMKVPKGTIMSRLFHARRKMQAALADYVEGELSPQTDSEEEGDGTR